MVMIVAARIFGLVRLRVLAHFFVDEDLSLFFAAFRLPDLIFEVLTLGALSSAFIPVFTKIYKKDEAEAWDTAARVVNLGLIVFAVFALLFGLFAHNLYALIAPGYSIEQREQIAYLARVLFAAQGFFVVSYALTGVLESLRRFLIPAFAPLFYNLGIIIGTYLFADQFGLLAPALGVIIGALAHFLIQLPFAYRLGFRFALVLRPTSGIKKIGKLALPRIIELSFLQLTKISELFLSSLISTAAYTYYNFAYSAQALPVGLFGLSMAKAALPTLTAQSDDPKKFKKTLLSTLYQVIFLIIPVTTMLIVLRIPVVRLLFGTDIFDWPATVQTGLVLSAFAIGVPFQAATLVLTRAFYALHDTSTPVKVSLTGGAISILTSFTLILGLHYPTWGLALGYALGTTFQAISLFFLLSKRLNGKTLFAVGPILKNLFASIVAGLSMFLFLKFFDRSVWVKRLSFLSNLEATKNLNFENFVLDTRYTGNLIILTAMTAFLGLVIYVIISFLMGSEELFAFIRLIKRRRLSPPPAKEQETVIPTPSDGTQV